MAQYLAAARACFGGATAGAVVGVDLRGALVEDADVAAVRLG